jgi:hypothetical protein
MMLLYNNDFINYYRDTMGPWRKKERFSNFYLTLFKKHGINPYDSEGINKLIYNTLKEYQNANK